MIGGILVELSDREKKILNYLREYIQQKGFPPAIREIGDAVSLKSPSTVHLYLKRLEEKNYIRRDPSKPRSIELIHGSTSPKRMVYPPVVGRVQAGQPITTIENFEDTLPLPYDIVGSDDCFVLTVQGDSMIDAGILEGDNIVVSRDHTYDNGDIVVAMIDDEITVKRYFFEKNKIRLQPENSSMEAMIFNPEMVEIIGKVTTLIRAI